MHYTSITNRYATSPRPTMSGGHIPWIYTHGNDTDYRISFDLEQILRHDCDNRSKSIYNISLCYLSHQYNDLKPLDYKHCGLRDHELYK